MEEEKELEESSEEKIEEFFDYIDICDEVKIKENLKGKKIWEFVSKEEENSTVLHLSVFKKLYNISELFIEYCKKYNKSGLNKFINQENDHGITALHYASFRGNVKIIRLLIENGANIYTKTKRGLNVIHYSAQGNKPSSLMFFYLIFKEKNNYSLITDNDSGGSTPLHWAAFSNAEDTLLYLINLDCFKTQEEKLNYINKPDFQGYTPLHLSVNSKSKRTVMKLLQNGASSDLKDKKGKTPLDLAKSQNQKEIAEIIKNNQACQICTVKAPVKQIKKSIKNIIIVFVVQIITTTILYISIISIAFNTGQKNPDVKYSIFFTIYIVLLLLFFILYSTLLIKDPGEIKSQPIDILPTLLQNNINLSKYCYKCFIKKRKYSQHCIICDKCFSNFDHHCYWINKCVAENNYNIFLLFLLETFFYLAFVLFISILALIHLVNSTDIGSYYNKFYFNLGVFNLIITNLVEQKSLLYILNIALILIDSFFLIPETLLLILHFNVCISNRQISNGSSHTKISPRNSAETSLIADITNDSIN